MIKFNDQSLTANIVTLSVFGALNMYLVSMAALFKLRRSEPNLYRPFKAPFYPVFPAIALGLGLFSLLAMIYFNFSLFVLYMVLMAIAYGVMMMLRNKHLASIANKSLTAL